MGTTISVKVVSDCSAEEFTHATADVFETFIKLEKKFSRFRPDSELTQLNQAGGAPFAASAEFLEVANHALQLAKDSDGAFDPTILNALEIAGYTKDFESLNGQAIDTHQPAQKANYRAVVLDADTKTITLPKQLSLDLGGIVKGYAVDQATISLCKQFGNFILNAGGDIALRGHNLEGDPWRAGIEHPSQTGELLATLALTDRAVATSGIYKRHWSKDGIAKHHIIDPATSDSTTNELVSVTVLANSVEIADSLATTIFVLGIKRGLAFAKRKKVECLLVTKDFKLLGTPNIEKYVI